MDFIKEKLTFTLFVWKADIVCYNLDFQDENRINDTFFAGAFKNVKSYIKIFKLTELKLPF